MGDCTAVQLIVHACPPERARVFLDVIAETGMEEPFIPGEGATPEGFPPRKKLPPNTLILGGAYMAPEVSCGWSDETAAHLAQEAPDAAWTVWEDPRYEWLGNLNVYTPELGLWGAECSAEGVAQFNKEKILAAVDDRDRLRRLLGLPWDETIAELAKEAPQTVAVPLLLSVVTTGGTAMAEATLCAAHHADTDLRRFAEGVAADAEDVSRPLRWADSTGKDDVRCVECPTLDAAAVTS